MSTSASTRTTPEAFSETTFRRDYLRAEYLGRFLGLADCVTQNKPDYILKTLIEIADEYHREQKALDGL